MKKEKQMDISKSEIILVIGSLVSTIGVLWGALSFLYKKMIDQREKEKEDYEIRLKKYEESHSECLENTVVMTTELRELTGQLKFLEGRMAGVENLSASVLEAVSKAQKKE